jgi:hypothetical protein
MPFLPQPKIGKRIRTPRMADRALDKAENARVLKRSEGRCEVSVITTGTPLYAQRCLRAGAHPHHMIYGRGKRARGKSCLAVHKQWVCPECHEAIHGGVNGRRLERVGDVVPHWTDCYRRVR